MVKVMEEKEIKVEILNDYSFNEVTKIVEELYSISFDAPLDVNDVYYDKDNFYFNLNHGLRIRNKNEIAYKALFYIPQRLDNKWFVLEKEYKLPITKSNFQDLLNTACIEYTTYKEILNYDDIIECFISLGFSEHIKIIKKRRKSKNKDFEVCVDEVKDLGVFVEIEAQSDSLLNQLKDKLPFNYKNIRHGYTNLYIDRILNINIPDFNDNFLKNPNWNYLNNQKEIVDKLLY